MLHQIHYGLTDGKQMLDKPPAESPEWARLLTTFMHDSVSKKPSEASTMTEENIKEVLTSVKKGSLSVDDG